MTIEKNKVVLIDYTLKNKSGEILDDSKATGPLEYIHGNGDIIRGLEAALEGKSAGEALSVVVEPADGYGEVREDLFIPVSRLNFPDDSEIEVGMQFEAANGQIVTVKELGEEEITVDANHPLAGERLFFDVTILDVRDATEEELANNFLNACSCGGSCGGGCGENCGGSCGGESCEGGGGDGGCGGNGGCGCHGGK